MPRPTIKLQTGQINLEQGAPAPAMFDRPVAETFTVLPVTGGHFRTEARFADRDTPALRAGYAPHLAAAPVHGASVHTLDQRLAEAGPVLGVPTRWRPNAA